MAKGAYIGIAGKARKTKKMYIGVGGKARKVKKAYIGIGGKARLFFSSGYGSSIPGLYAIDAYDHRRIVKLNAATLAIECQHGRRCYLRRRRRRAAVAVPHRLRCHIGCFGE